MDKTKNCFETDSHTIKPCLATHSNYSKRSSISFTSLIPLLHLWISSQSYLPLYMASEGVTEEMRRRVSTCLKDNNPMTFEKQSNAYSNNVYKVTTQGKKQFIYKEYLEDKDPAILAHENKIQRKLGYIQILESNNKYKIESYQESTEVNFKVDLVGIAKEMKNFHNLGIECNLTQAQQMQNILDENDKLRAIPCIKSIVDEFRALESGGKLVTCHNDLQKGNVLKVDGKIKFIDFEYSCMGHKYYDIANFFCETMTDYSVDSQLTTAREFSFEEKKQFLRAYFEKEDVDNELAKVKEMTPFCHLFWFIWAVNSAPKHQDSGFDYIKHAESRLFHLFRLGKIKEMDSIRLSAIISGSNKLQQ